MKEITLLIAVFAFVFVGNAQEIRAISDAGIGLVTPVANQTQFNKFLGNCDQGNSAGELNGAAGSNVENEFISAVDLIVADGDTFNLQSVAARVLTLADSGLPDFAVVTYYEDGGDGFPGALITSQVDIPITVLSTEPWANPAADVHDIEFDVDPIDFAADGGETTFWVGIQTSNTSDTSTFFELNQPEVGGDPIIVGEPIVQQDPTTEEWDYIDFTDDDSDPENDSEGVYELRGDCQLGVNNTLLSQVSVFPNPVNDILNINVPASVELNGATLYDVLGKATNVSLSNGQINISGLSRGLYILNVNTSAGTLTEKVIIE